MDVTIVPVVDGTRFGVFVDGLCRYVGSEEDCHNWVRTVIERPAAAAKGAVQRAVRALDASED